VKEGLFEILRCPRCGSDISDHSQGPSEGPFRCQNERCALSAHSFPMLGTVPVLVDFEESILTRDSILVTGGGSYKDRRAGILQRIAQWMLVSRQAPTDVNAKRFLSEVKRLAKVPNILVIGGGSIGNKADSLYSDPGVHLFGSDIYKSSLTDLIADGHQLPISSNSVHGVWIQAVLEHVLDPWKVVGEIRRVLVPGGLVYAETPFMQQVHEGPYDFTRFTLSGHRWLFRAFQEIDSGITSGPATVMLWSIRYLVGAIVGNYKIGTLAALSMSWIRLFDRFVKKSYAEDGPSGVYFLGRGSDRLLSRSEIVAFYRGPQG
jgi:SAM-dependent methyltransferase